MMPIIVDNIPLVETVATTTITSLVTLGIVGLLRRNKKIGDSVTKDEMENKITERINEHERSVHTSIHDVINDIKQDNVRIEGKLDKLLLLMIKK